MGSPSSTPAQRHIADLKAYIKVLRRAYDDMLLLINDSPNRRFEDRENAHALHAGFDWMAHALIALEEEIAWMEIDARESKRNVAQSKPGPFAASGSSPQAAR